MFILFVYQSLLVAWNFVQEREFEEGRRIRAEDFAEKFCASKDVVNKLKEEFKSDIEVTLLCKNIDGTNRFYRKNINRIDDFIQEKYNKEQILELIKPPE